MRDSHRAGLRATFEAAGPQPDAGREAYLRISSNSISNTSVALAGITPPTARFP
jgi:hypothetical protein